jgi:nucleotide-binding universal stress UspA family protein
LSHPGSIRQADYHQLIAEDTMPRKKRASRLQRTSSRIVKKPRVKAIRRSHLQQWTFALKCILVPIDFSEYSKNALKYAVPFAKQFGAEIILIYVVEPTTYPADFSFGQFGFPNVEDEFRARGEEELSALMEKEIRNEVKASKQVRTGKAYLEIIKMAREKEVDLIIIATHGHSGVEHMLFGSTAEKVVRKAPCPVLSLRPDERDFIKQ